MLERYLDDELVEDGHDHDDLATLIERYDLAINVGSAKRGTGIDHFERRRYGGKGLLTASFWVVHPEGTQPTSARLWRSGRAPKAMLGSSQVPIEPQCTCPCWLQRKEPFSCTKMIRGAFVAN